MVSLLAVIRKIEILNTHAHVFGLTEKTCRSIIIIVLVVLWEKPAYSLINVTHVICIIVHYTFVRMVNWKSEIITYLCIWSASVSICLSFCLCCNHAQNCDIISQGDKAISRNRQKMWYLGCPYHTSGLAVFTLCWQLAAL